MRWDAPHLGPLGSSTASGRSPSRPSTSIRSGRRRCCPALRQACRHTLRHVRVAPHQPGSSTHCCCYKLTHGRFATPLLFPAAVLETKGTKGGMRRHNAVPYLNDGTASRSSHRTPERRDTQLVSQPPSGPRLPMWDTIGGMAAPSCIGLSHRLVLVRYCENGPRPGNVTDG
jgi:hypothetical protein